MKISTPVYVTGNQLVDAKYGPYLTLTQALSLLPISDRKIGQTVGIYDGTGIVEYWFKDDIQDINLVIKGSSTGFVPYTGATQNVDLGEYELKAGQIEFDQSPTGTSGVAVLRWNNTDGTLDLGLKGGNVTLQIGQEQLIRVVNKTGADLLESDFYAVRVRSVAEGGAQGQRLAVVLAQANNDANSSTTIGLVTENINNNQEGFITIQGNVNEINTTGAKSYGGLETWVDGDILYLNPDYPGYLTNVKPSAPDHMIIIGYVVYAHSSHGKIYVKVDNGYELEELHNVTSTNYTTPVDADSILTYDNTNSLWKRLTWANIKSTLKTYFDTLYQVIITGAASTITTSNLTASRVLVSDSSGKVGVSSVTNTTLGYLDATSSIQTQLNSKAADSGVVHTTGNETVGGLKTFSSLITGNLGIALTAPTGSGADKVGITVSGSNTNGGTNYLDFLKATNNAVGATNINKYFRLNSTGGIEIVNSAYSSVIFTLTDNGTLNGATQAEMSYLSGVTSSIQTQLDSLRKLYTSQRGVAAPTGTLNTEAELFTISIPAGTIATTGRMWIEHVLSSTGSGSETRRFRIRIGTSNANVLTNTLIADYLCSTSGNTAVVSDIQKLVMNSLGTSLITPNAGALSSTNAGALGMKASMATLSYNPASQILYITVTYNKVNNTANTMVVEDFAVYYTKS